MSIFKQYYGPLFWFLSFGIIMGTLGLQCHFYAPNNSCGPGQACGSQLNVTTCPHSESSSFSCFASWRVKLKADNSTAKEKILQYAGCFENDKTCANQGKCVSKSNGKAMKGSNTLTYYCCCDKDFCNNEYEAVPVATTTTTTVAPVPEKREPERKSKLTLVLLVVLIPTFGICLLIICSVQRRLTRKNLGGSVSQLTDEEKILVEKTDGSQSLPITLVEMKATGRFGKVWRGTLAGSSSWVAVKIISMRERASWKLEQDIYGLPLMSQSDYILRYIGAQTYEQPEIENLQLWLVTEYLEYGSLYDYLKGNTVTWADLLKIATTMCNGLAFLHDEIDGGAKGHKPAVAHRDFKSKNVLLRPDLTACIADFGLAHIFYPSQPVGTVHGQAGTRRYMAPEVLDGAVCFTRDNFQRTDMYACALVLWELATRCTSHAGGAKDYRMPFEEYITHHPSMDEMRELVVTERQRPTIQNQWLSHPGLAVLAEAMRDAWDQDAEARISASCIVERLNAISENVV